jgi:hypothetical protein
MMKKFFQKLLGRILNLILKKQSSLFSQGNLVMNKYTSIGKKNYFTGNDSLLIECTQQAIKKEINNEAKIILKEAIQNPEMLLDFIKSKDTIIVKSNNINKILFFFGKSEGFIPPMKGLKALIFCAAVNLFTGKKKLKIKFETPAMFALKDKPVNIYFLSHQFHLWLSYLNKLPGFENKNLDNFRNFWHSNKLSKLSIDEIVSLKDIVKRELEAIDFVKEMARELVGQKQSLIKIKRGKSVNL